MLPIPGTQIQIPPGSDTVHVLGNCPNKSEEMLVIYQLPSVNEPTGGRTPAVVEI